MSSNKKIYCISGLAADEKVMSKLHIQGYEMQFIPWVIPQKNESFDTYILRMDSAIQEEDPIILGYSFGGMVALEIARKRPVKKVILISSIKSSKELPFYMKAAGLLHLQKIVQPFEKLKLTYEYRNYRIGAQTQEEKTLINHYRETVNPVYLDWSLNHIFNWRNEWYPQDVLHIHGSDDKIFPIKNIKPTFTIPQGSHLMIYNRAQEICAYISEHLEHR